MDLPAFESYGQHSSSNYGAHALRFHMGRLRVWFSYQTPVAFSLGIRPPRVRENEWGPTTGKHLNWIDDGDRKSRIPGEQFERELRDAMAECGIATGSSFA